ncbi:MULTISPECIES: hypothetical protein [unclassified Sinorhizobium]|uniref:hypothetical protein n=1 Tax=unclassified Sinorhizobium TaxID=2613772 RepID=UPI0035253D7D
MNEKQLPVASSAMTSGDILHFRTVILKYKEGDLDAIARFLRDSFEEIAILEIDKECRNCGSWGMKVYVGHSNELLAYECKVCGYSEYSDGTKVKGERLDFADIDRLEKSGLIQGIRSD